MSSQGCVYSWCGCREPGNGRRMGSRCPLRGEEGHGSWYLSLELPVGLDGRRRRIRRGGFPSQDSAGRHWRGCGCHHPAIQTLRR
jgi:hypothetical protein